MIQSTAGAGQIILDDGADSGTGLNGNSGTVTLTPGTGGVQTTLFATGTPLASNEFTASGTTLNLALGFAPTPGTQITIVDNTATPAESNPIVGEFSNLAPGSIVTLSYQGTSYPFLVDYQGGDGNDLVLSNSAGTATQFIVTSQSQSPVTAGGTIDLTITAEDAHGNVVTDFSDSITLSDSLGGASFSVGSFSGGVATVTATLDTAGAQSFTASDPTATISGTSSLVTVTPAAASKLLVSSSLSSLSAGGTTSLSITAEDRFGNVVIGFSDSVTLADNLGGASFSAASFSDGLATLTATLDTAGTQSLTISDPAATISGTSGPVTVTPVVASKLLVSSSSSSLSAGGTTSVTITAEDRFGNLITGFSDSVTLSDNLGGATFSTASFSGGVATLTATLDTAGTQSLTASDPTAAISSTSNGISVTPGTATQLLIMTQPPSTVTAGSNFGFAVTTEDLFGNIATGYSGSVTVALKSNPGGSTLGGTTTATVTGGVATFSGLTLNNVDPGYTLQTTSGTLTSATSNAISVASSQASGGGLLAYEGFNGAVGPLEREADGSGWNTSTAAGAVGWNVQNLSTTTPGYQVNAAGLTYPNLQTSTGSASGGTSYLTAGLRLDTTTTFAAYDVPGTKQIGAAGTTLWFSVLVDRQTAVGAGQAPTSLDFTSNATEWYDATRDLGVGYYGSPSDSGGVGYWSLLVGSTIVRSTVPIVVGQTSLLVLGMTFGTTGDTFSLYVNPTSLGGSAPTAPNAQLTGSNITFSSVIYNAGYTPGVSTIDELRLGTSFGAVTPVSSGGKATPSVMVTDNSGPYTGAAFAATDTVNGNSSLEGVSPTLTYYSGTSGTGTPLNGAPTTAGTYTVVANFAGSADFTSASANTTFAISLATPTVALAINNGAYAATVAGVNGVPDPNLEGATPILTYYTGTSATGTPLSGAPSAAGTYTVLANFAGSSDYTSANASTTFTIGQSNSGGLLAYEGFNGSVGALEGETDGSGWNTSTAAGAVGWYVQNLSTTTPGYQVNATGLTYPNLQTSGGSASGGSAYLTAGRRLDTTTTFAAYDVPGTKQIGANGTTLWFSVLVDRQTAVGGGQSPTLRSTSTTIRPNGTTASHQLGVGYYGSSSDSGGVGYWSLLVGSTVVRSNVPMVVGQTALLVLGMTFSSHRRHLHACMSIRRRWAARPPTRPTHN